MERRSTRPGDENVPAGSGDERLSQRDTRTSGTVRSALARSVHQHRGFLELARVVAAGEQGVWTGALPLLLGPAGAAWGVAYRVVGATLEMAASEALPTLLRPHVETFDFARHNAFAACRAVRSRRVVSDDRLFSGTLSTKTLQGLEAAGIAAGTAVPIVHGGAVFGVLLVGSSTREPFDTDSLGFLEAAASFLAPALAIAESSQHPAVERSSPPSRLVSNAPERASSHPAPPPRRATDAARAVLDALQQAAPVLRRLGTDVRVANDDDCFALCEPGELRLAIANLVVNAAEAASERAPLAGAPTTPRRVRVSVAREGAGVAICVDDSGRGVPHDLRARVFEPGFSTRGKGRGDGLHMVRQFASEHGGHVEIAASEMGGASFRLLLPATHIRPEVTPGPSRHTSATWPQLRIPTRVRESRPAGGSRRRDDDSGSDDDSGDGHVPSMRSVSSW